MRDSNVKTLVWDLPTRVFHWLLVVSFAGAFVTAESEGLRDLHLLLGYSAAGLVAFRLLWGLVGTLHARFASFPLSPRAVGDYLKSLLALSPRHYFGHNPAGSWAILAMLALLITTAATGWAQAIEIGPRWVEDLHEQLANATVALVVIHVAAVVLSSLLHRENLVRAMISGYKSGSGPTAVGTRWVVALLLVGTVVAFWAGTIPAPGLEAGESIVTAVTKQGAPRSGHRSDRHDDDND